MVFVVACLSLLNLGADVGDKPKLNVLGERLISCGSSKPTGFYRDGFCATGPDDRGVHVVCAEVTKEFLEFSKSRGNDLITPHPEHDFKGLVPGDRWCLCANRWKEAFDHDVAPPVVLEATHDAALKYVRLDNLKKTQLQKDKE